MKDALGHGSDPRGGATRSVGIFTRARMVMQAIRQRQNGKGVHAERIDQLPTSMSRAAKERVRLRERTDARHYDLRNSR